MLIRLLEQRRGGNVKRFHTMTMLRENLVSSHSWGVAMNILYMHPECSAELIKAALWHDIAECVTGDMPATTKWAFPDLAKRLKLVEKEVEKDLGITPGLFLWEQDLLKVADMGDLVLSCIEEYRLGNEEALGIAYRGLQFLKTMEPEMDSSKKFIKELEEYIGGVQ